MGKVIMSNTITRIRLLELFEYNEDTGEFLRKITVSSKGIKGTVAGCKSTRGNTTRYLICVDSLNYDARQLVFLYCYGKHVEAASVITKDGDISNTRLSNLTLAYDLSDFELTKPYLEKLLKYNPETGDITLLQSLTVTYREGHVFVPNTSLGYISLACFPNCPLAHRIAFIL